MKRRSRLSSGHPSVTYFQRRRSGPELAVEDCVVERVPELFPFDQPAWIAGSATVGAGRPDLVLVSYHPQVVALSKLDLSKAQVLAYLRAVRGARLDTIAERTRMRPAEARRTMDMLVDMEAVHGTIEGRFALSPLWRDILPEVITIEVKVSNWSKAVAQAQRNRIFAHRSFVALPDPVAERIQSEAILRQLGIGLLSVSEAGEVRILKSARLHRPSVWIYYYQLASLLARNSRN